MTSYNRSNISLPSLNQQSLGLFINGELVQLAGLARFIGMVRLIPWFPFKFPFC